MQAEGVTEKAAVEEMRTLVQEYNDVVRKSGFRTRILNGFTVAGIAASIASSLIFPPAGLAAAFFPLGKFGVEKYMPTAELSPEQQAAAIFYDARKKFGWR